ncbi:MAG: hypothetical protein FJ104_15555, partial [Deltaproteobacteria bacterium]|nr:hypothetical protein [Deltaproteobacteria bacterium]
MPRGSPLDSEALRAVDRLLDARAVLEAQRQLATLGGLAGSADGVAYLSTRMLWERGRLAPEQVADRMRDLLLRWPEFAEASLLLTRAQAGGPTVRSDPPPRPPISAPPA